MLWSEYGKVGWEWVVQAVRGREKFCNTSSQRGRVIGDLSFLRELGLNWFVGPEYSFGIFSMSRLAPPPLSSVYDPN